MTAPQLLLTLVPATPVAAALGLLRPTWERFGVVLLLLSAALALAVSLWAPPGASAVLPSILLGIELAVDATGRVFFFFTALLWLLAGIYARGYLQRDPASRRFFAFFAFAMAGNFGLTLSADMVSFYLFFAMMSFASYGLIVHNGSPEAHRAGRVYLVLVIVGEILIFTALVLIASDAGSLALSDAAASLARSPRRDTCIALLLLGFGIKAGALPLHVWLPLAHPAAPTPASAVLSGAMINAGLLAWLRFLPLSHTALPGWGTVLIAAGLSAALLGVLAGLSQNNPKTILAYSSISQMGLMTAAVGIGLREPSAWELAQPVVFFALHHALAKGALFLGVGVLGTAPGHRYNSLVRTVGLLLPALALVGFPLTSGSSAKAALKKLFGELPSPWSATLTTLFAAATIATTLLMAHLYVEVIKKGTSEEQSAPSLVGSWLTLVVAVALVPLLGPVSLAPHKAFTVSALWPVGLGLLLAFLVWRRRGSLALPLSIPAGDILSAWSAGTRLLGPPLRRLGRRIVQVRADACETCHSLVRPAGRRFLALVSGVEEHLGTWHFVGLGFLALIVAQLVASLW